MNQLLGYFFGLTIGLAGLWVFIRHVLIPTRRVARESSPVLLTYLSTLIAALLTAFICLPATRILWQWGPAVVLLVLVALSPFVHRHVQRHGV